MRSAKGPFSITREFTQRQDLRVLKSDEWRAKTGNIIATFFQRRDRDRHDIQAGERALDGMCLLICGIQVFACAGL